MNAMEARNTSSSRMLAVYGFMLLSMALGLAAYLSLRNALHVALVRFDIYVFAWRAIDIGITIAALVGILVLTVADLYGYKKAASQGRLLRAALTQCGILAGLALLFFLTQTVLLA